MANQLYKGNTPLATFVPEIVDNLTTNDSTKALSAKQGKILNDKVDDLNTKTTPISLPITIIPNNGYVDSIAGYAYKIGKILFFNIRDIRPVNTAASTNWVHVGTISNWSSNEECFAHLLSQGLNSVELTVRIGGDGKIYFYTQSAMDGTKIFRGMTMTISTNY